MNSTITMMDLAEPDYITLTDFERNFDVMYWRKIWSEYWVISVYLSAIYLALVFGGVFLMKSRKPFKLNGLLTIWNIVLSIISIWIFYRMAPEFVHNLFGENGLYYTICEWKNHNGATAFWGFVLMCSKVFEFGDTVFVVLRKQNLRFIHYFHHVVTAVCCWSHYAIYEPTLLWVLVMNAFVHSFMYPYYTLRSMKIRVPKIIAMGITSLQLLQMFAGIFINLYSIWVMYFIGTPADCPQRTSVGICVCFGTYIIFAILFGKFFINAYVNIDKRKSKKL